MSKKSIFRKKSINQILADVKAIDDNPHSTSLAKSLRLRDLVSFGIAAIIGAGIFSTIGNACADGGPAVSLLFIFTAFACIFSALCYAQFASTVPISGSAYTYAYTTFGEIVAWILGWNLLFEYAIGNIAVAISWSDYFTNLLKNLGLHLPDYLTMDYLSATRAIQKIADLNTTGKASEITESLRIAENAWNTAPIVGGLHLIADIPALLITLLTSALIIKGIKESRNVGNIMVLVKMAVVLMVILIGAFYVKSGNWSPFAPNGVEGVLKGVSAVFFAYIGFDAISTTAEECENPQRDLPKAMIYTLIICTVLYVLITLVLTGMVSYTELRVGDPMAYVFGKVGLDFVEGVVAVSAVVAMASVFLVFQLGQPRIWMSMSRDGLLPAKFAEVHPRYQTPVFSSIIAGLLVAIPSLFLNLTEVTDLCSIGTLFAFALVSGGILLLSEDENTKTGSFKVPYVNGKFIVPALFIGIAGYVAYSNPDYFSGILTLSAYPSLLFWFTFLGMAAWSFQKNLSIIPVMGVLTNIYLMSVLDVVNWNRFLWWCVIGIIIYFAYSYKRSKLGK